MKKRIVYLGPNNNHKREDLKNLALEYLRNNKGDRFYYLLPNRELLNQYRFEMLDKLEATFDMNFITFDDIVNKIMEASAYKIANDPIKRIVMRKILDKLKKSGKMDYYDNFTDYQGFIESCIYIIGNIKRSLITPQDYLVNSPNQAYFKELGLIYEAYEGELEEKGYLDKEGLYLKSIDLLKNNSSFLDGLDFIVIDEFYDFRPVELEIIRLLETMDLDIYINIPYKSHIENRRLKETIGELEKLNFEFKEIHKDEFNDFEVLGKLIFNNNSSKTMANIELTKASSLYLEVKSIIKKIKTKFHYKSIDLKDNCICILNNKYRDMVIDVANEEKVPISIAETLSLKGQPLAREIINLIETVISSAEKDVVLDRIKSSYLSLFDENSRDDYEYILRKSSFKDLDDLYDKLTIGVSMDIPDKYNEGLLAIIDKLRNEIDLLKGRKSLSEYNKALLEILQGYEIENKILERYKSNKNFHLLKRDLSIAKYIKELLDTMEATIFTDDEFELDEYLMVLTDYFNEEDITVKEGNPNGIKVVTIDNARGLKYKYIYIPGLNQENYPNVGTTNFFLSDDNYYVLKKIGIDYKDYRNRLDNEILKFVSLISSCQEKLYLSYTDNLEADDGGKALYSIFLDEILHKLTGEQEEDKLVVKQVDLNYLYNNEIKNITSSREFTLKILNDYYNDKLELSSLKYHNNFFGEKIQRLNLQFESEIYRSYDDFNHYNGLLEDDFVREYISNKFKDSKFSVSFLEDYSICPYSFLLKNLFNIEAFDREIEDYNPMTRGSIYHEVLRIYYENYKEELNNIEEFDFTNTLDFLKESVEGEGEKQGYNLESIEDLILTEHIFRKLVEFIQEDIERLKKHPNIKPWSFEEWFDMEYEVDGKKANIRGIIDRIDKIDNDKYVIIDYKSSSFSKRSIYDIREKISLQLPIYILSQEDKNVVAGFYGIINDSDFFNCMGILGESNLVTNRQKGKLTREEWDEILYETKLTIGELIREMHKGNFAVAPRECSPYCDYKDICRYDRTQEVE